VIVEMAKVRVFGPRSALSAAVATLQDFGQVHLVPPADGGGELSPSELPERELRERTALSGALADCQVVLSLLPAPTSADDSVGGGRGIGHAVKLAGRLRGEVESLAHQLAALEEERALLGRHRATLEAFAPLLALPSRLAGAHADYVVLRSGGEEAVEQLRAALREGVGDGFELRSRPLPNGETALLLLVATSVARRVESILAAARVEDVPVPAGFGGSLAEALPRLAARLDELPREIATRRGTLERLAAAHAAELSAARARLFDRLARLEARERAVVTPRAFVLEGWVPRARSPILAQLLDEKLGREVVISEVARERWLARDAPVVLSNPRLFRPFEAILAPLPLPVYGTIDPTPFVAIFFPALFGLMLGDIGYGLLLGVIALVLHRRSKPESRLRSIAEIAGACALSSTLFGFLYGDLLGDLGRRWLGLRPLLFDREVAVLPFLGLAVAIGFVHIVLGLVLSAVATFRGEPRHAIGKGLAAIMVSLVGAALAATLGLLPKSFFTPLSVALLVAFPLLVLAEGLIAPLELLATLGNVLSYARVMALGVASVMLAVVANRLAGAMGVAAIGIAFALLFHLVNFALGLFSPTIHALRLHYVEFFGKFYSPGGIEFRPFAHGTATPGRTS
jgi:V/A-type H+-transporting ATPase subunit I